MADNAQNDKPKRVFCSYSSADRQRVTGLGLLIEALGYEVFLDHKTITPGARWQANLQEGLDDADVFVVYWTKYSSKSNWVRKEIEYFHTRFPNRLLIPIVGDETPLSELLSVYQKSDFFPLINELLDLKRKLEREGVKQKDIRNAILVRLREAGIDIEEDERDRLFTFFAGSGLIGLIATPGLVFGSMYNRGVETLSQLTARQGIALAFASATGAALCSLIDNSVTRSPILTAETPQQINVGANQIQTPSTPTSTAGVVQQSTIDSDQTQTTDPDYSSIDLTTYDRFLGRWTAELTYSPNDNYSTVNDLTEEYWFEIRRNCQQIFVETSASAASLNNVLIGSRVLDFNNYSDLQNFYNMYVTRDIIFRDAEKSSVRILYEAGLIRNGNEVPYWGHYYSIEEKWRELAAQFGEEMIADGDLTNLRKVSSYEAESCD